MNVWKILTLPCEEASKLASRAMDERLSTSESLALSAHMLSCRLCRRFRRQLRVMRSASEMKGLEPEARERIRKSLEDES